MMMIVMISCDDIMMIDNDSDDNDNDNNDDNDSDNNNNDDDDDDDDDSYLVMIQGQPFLLRIALVHYMLVTFLYILLLYNENMILEYQYYLY